MCPTPAPNYICLLIAQAHCASNSSPTRVPAEPLATRTIRPEALYRPSVALASHHECTPSAAVTARVGLAFHTEMQITNVSPADLVSQAELVVTRRIELIESADTAVVRIAVA